MSDVRKREQQALLSSQRSVTQFEGKGQPKIGPEEFMSIAERFGFTETTLAKIRAAISEEDWGSGPFLGNYYANLPETKVQAFQRTAREVFGAKHALGVSSGTAALHAAFVAAGVGPGTEVICPAIGFFATAAAVVMSNGVPVFCDVDESLHMDPKKIKALITKRTAAIAPTHVMGGVCDMDPIMKVARGHKVKVIEDCAQSNGATYKGRLVGTIGDLGCFSISAYKIVGGGEGGLVLTDHDRLWDRANCLAEGGGLWRPERFAAPRYEGELFCGTNYRMSELEAAVDVVQLRKMPETVNRFRTAKKRVVSRLKTYRGITPQKINDPDGEVGYLLRFYPETVDLGEKIVMDLKARGIGAGMRGRSGPPDWHVYRYMYPLTLKRGPTPANCPFECPIYRERGGAAHYAIGDCPVADDLFDRMVSIGLNQWYTEKDCIALADAVNEVLSAQCAEDADGRPWR